MNSVPAKHYPPCANWDFGDPHWTSPDAFKVLLRWVPHVSHGEKEGDKDGFFTLNGVRDRQTTPIPQRRRDAAARARWYHAALGQRHSARAAQPRAERAA